MSHWEYEANPATASNMEVITKDGEFTARVSYDGCVNLRRHYITGDQDYIHICELDEFIALLQELQAMGKAHFGDQ